MILFYEPMDEYGYFSNFSRHAIDLNGKRWPTTEHYFQAAKSTERVVQERIRGARTPGQAARLGRSTRLRPDWDQTLEDPLPGWFLLNGTRVIERYKDAIMFQAVYAKFTQHEDLKANLLATGDEVLVENAMADPYWGWGCSKTGINKLGQILMLCRERIRHGQG